VDAPVVDTLVRWHRRFRHGKGAQHPLSGPRAGTWQLVFPRDYYIGGIQAEIIYQAAAPGSTSAGIVGNAGPDRARPHAGHPVHRKHHPPHGSCGIHPRDGASDTLIQGNRFYDTTGAAVQGGRWAAGLADPKPEISANTVISNNVIRNTGADFMAASLINNLRHQDFRVTHNDMADAPYMGFHQRIDLSLADSTGIGGTVVSSNKVAMANTGGRYGVGDGGYIYTYGIWPDSTVSGNDIDTINVAGGNVSGFYLDNSSYGIRINGNVMRGVKAGSMGYKFVRSLNDDRRSTAPMATGAIPP
jgi:hypothetical protein